MLQDSSKFREASWDAEHNAEAVEFLNTHCLFHYTEVWHSGDDLRSVRSYCCDIRGVIRMPHIHHGTRVGRSYAMGHFSLNDIQDLLPGQVRKVTGQGKYKML